MDAVRERALMILWRNLIQIRSGSDNSSDTYGPKYCTVEAQLRKNVLHVVTFKWTDFIQIQNIILATLNQPEYIFPKQK